MKRILFFLIFLFICKTSDSQDSISIREIDLSAFKKVKLFLNIFNEKGNMSFLDSNSLVFINDEGNKNEILIKTENFYYSDEPVGICVLVDVSWSMSGEGGPLDNVKKGLNNILSNFRINDQIAIHSFLNTYHPLPFTSNKLTLESEINDLEAQKGGTFLFESVIKTLRWMNDTINNKNVPKRKILIIISDGENNITDGISIYNLNDCLKEISKYKIPVFTIGSTNKITGEFLNNLEKLSETSAALYNDGKYYKIKKPDDISILIPEIYKKFKYEYILKYWTYADTNKNINGILKIITDNKQIIKSFSYQTPNRIFKYPPDKSYPAKYLIIVGIILLGLITWIIIVYFNKKRLRETYNNLLNDFRKLNVDLEKGNFENEELKKKINNLKYEINKTGTKLGFSLSDITKVIGEDDIPFGEYSGRFLMIKSGVNAGKQIQYLMENDKFEMILGRPDGGKKTDFNILSDNKVTRLRHARIFYREGDFYIEDLGSKNGTFVNGIRITKSTALASRSIITLGNTDIVFK